VRTSCAPKCCKIFLLSILNDSGNVKIIRYPFAAAMDAKLIPVFPLVGSIITLPVVSFPSFSAVKISDNQILSFTEPFGLSNSVFARIGTLIPLSAEIFGNARRCVSPIKSRTLEANVMGIYGEKLKQKKNPYKSGKLIVEADMSDIWNLIRIPQNLTNYNERLGSTYTLFET